MDSRHDYNYFALHAIHSDLCKIYCKYADVGLTSAAAANVAALKSRWDSFTLPPLSSLHDVDDVVDRYHRLSNMMGALRTQ